jgi:thiol-disulfide isomerase/thioredoxin
MIYLLILLLVISIITNIIISNSINENFGDPNSLIYLSKTKNCENCVDLDPIWENIKKEVNNNYLYYNNFIIDKKVDDEAQKIADVNSNGIIPAILFKKDKKYSLYTNKAKDMNAILDWAKAQAITS